VAPSELERKVEAGIAALIAPGGRITAQKIGRDHVSRA
jgi:hypothetical protein